MTLRSSLSCLTVLLLVTKVLGALSGREATLQIGLTAVNKWLSNNAESFSCDWQDSTFMLGE
jgi:hypothetical protein